MINRHGLSKDLTANIKLTFMRLIQENLINSDKERMNKLFTELAIKNYELIYQKEYKLGKYVNFIYKGRVYPKTYMGVTSLELQEELWDSADRLIKQINSIEDAHSHIMHIVKQSLMLSKNLAETLTYIPSKVLNGINNITSENFKELCFIPEYEITKFHKSIKENLTKIDRYLMSKTFFYD